MKPAPSAASAGVSPPGPKPLVSCLRLFRQWHGSMDISIYIYFFIIVLKAFTCIGAESFHRLSNLFIIIIFILIIGAFISIFQVNSKRRRAESFEACCHWVLLNVQVTLLFLVTVRKYIYPSVSKVRAGSFRVSVIHLTRTWTTGSLTCVCDHSYVCVYTQELGESAFLTRKNTHIFDCAPGGVWTSCHWMLDLMLYQLSHPVTPIDIYSIWPV